MKVLIVYYSTYGNVYRMATLVAEGVKEIPGAQPVVRTVPELIPKSVIDSREDMRAGRAMRHLWQILSGRRQHVNNKAS